MRKIRWLTVAGVLLGGACGGGSSAPVERLEGGILATFEVSGEAFRAWVTAPDAIDEILAVRDGLSAATIPNGAIHEGPGIAGHNQPWAWHFDPIDLQMAESTIELCDGRPSLVDSLLDDYLHVGRFCPWGARLVLVEDLR
jgi:hypothetical protein